MKGVFVLGAGGSKDKNSASEKKGLPNLPVVNLSDKLKEDGIQLKVGETNKTGQTSLTSSSVAKKDIETKPSSSMSSASSTSTIGSEPDRTRTTKSINRFKNRVEKLSDASSSLTKWADQMTTYSQQNFLSRPLDALEKEKREEEKQHKLVGPSQR